ncbi:hypothetical protein JHK82_043736 [Glycine max]|nr:hypothetical protein JHK82_043736 [Glycine max]
MLTNRKKPIKCSLHNLFLSRTRLYVLYDFERSGENNYRKIILDHGSEKKSRSPFKICLKIPASIFKGNRKSLRLACEYKDTLEEVFKEHSKMERANSTSRPHYEDSKPNNNNKQKENVSPFAAQLMRVMELLDTNLEGKAKLYKEVPLSLIFMMSNRRYIVQKIKGSTEIYEVMGETWCRKRSMDLRTYHKNYQVETWSKILSSLSPKGLNENRKVHKLVLKKRFKSFNLTFDLGGTEKEGLKSQDSS